MKITLEVPAYSPESGITYAWEDAFTINLSIENNSVNIQANKEGLVSLANHFLNLAQDAIPNGHHLHLDEFNSLEQGSIELIVEKKTDFENQPNK